MRCQCCQSESTMLKFFALKSLSKITFMASFLVSDSCFSAAQITKTSLVALTVSSCCFTRQPPWFACALQLPAFYLHCSLMHRQASRSQRWNSKTLPNCMWKCFRSFVHHTVQICGSIVTGRSEMVRMTMHSHQTYKFRFHLLSQKIVSSYNIAAVMVFLRSK